jgi:RNA recognition motif-containing protein
MLAMPPRLCLNKQCSEAYATREDIIYWILSFLQSDYGRSDDDTSNEKRVPKYMAQQNLFIGSLAYSTTDDSLKAHFEQIGEVASARVITDRDTGRSKGFGFVEYTDEANNQKAVDQLDGKELDGRAISVGLARPKEDRPRRDFNGGGNTGGNSRGGNGGGSFRQRSW